MIALSELKGSGGIFDYDSRKERLEEILLRLEDPSLWNNPEEAQRLGQERARLEETVEQLDGLARTFSDLLDLLELARLENDDETIEEIAKESEGAKQKLEKLEFRRMFSGEADEASAFVDIQAGSGGTEAQDWAEMLLRMYLRWSESGRYSVELVEKSEGEVAGIKSATIHVSGEYAYGYLRTETGVHRLVRKSPFDSGNRRHTSFASVYLPSGIVVQCQNDRSQHRNKAEAMSMLKSRLYEAEMRARQEEQQELENSKADIGWGSQIRSYVLDQSRIKDLRTGVETGNTQAVLDGDIGQFIEASLKAAL